MSHRSHALVTALTIVTVLAVPLPAGALGGDGSLGRLAGAGDTGAEREGDSPSSGLSAPTVAVADSTGTTNSAARAAAAVAAAPEHRTGWKVLERSGWLQARPPGQPAGDRTADGHRTAAGTAAAIKDGSFVQYRKTVFRVVGGALFHVTSWSLFGGKQPVRALTVKEFGRFIYWPLDGTFIRTVQDGRCYVFAGGAPTYITTWDAFPHQTPKPIAVDQHVLERAEARDYAFPYGWVNEVPMDWRRLPDGRLQLDVDLMLTVRTGSKYKVIGGSAQYSSWDGDYDPMTWRTVRIDEKAIERAGTGYPYNFLRRYPYDEWPIRSTRTAKPFSTAGGAVVSMPNVQSTVFKGLVAAKLSLANINNKNKPDPPWDHLLYRPKDGTFVTGVPSKRVYRIQGGRATYVPSWAPYGGPQWAPRVDDEAITKAGTGDDFDHLLPPG